MYTILMFGNTNCPVRGEVNHVPGVVKEVQNIYSTESQQSGAHTTLTGFTHAAHIHSSDYRGWPNAFRTATQLVWYFNSAGVESPTEFHQQMTGFETTSSTTQHVTLR